MLLVFHAFGGLLQISAYFIPDLLVFLLLLLHSLASFVFLTLHSRNNLFVFLKFLFKLSFPFLKQLVDFLLHLLSQLVVMLDLVFLGLDRLLAAHLHLYLLLQHILYFLNVIFLFHLSLPPDELACVLQAHLHLVQSSLVLLLFFVDQVFLAF